VNSRRVTRTGRNASSSNRSKGVKDRETPLFKYRELYCHLEVPDFGRTRSKREVDEIGKLNGRKGAVRGEGVVNCQKRRPFRERPLFPKSFKVFNSKRRHWLAYIDKQGTFRVDRRRGGIMEGKEKTFAGAPKARERIHFRRLVQENRGCLIEMLQRRGENDSEDPWRGFRERKENSLDELFRRKS